MHCHYFQFRGFTDVFLKKKKIVHYSYPKGLISLLWLLLRQQLAQSPPAEFVQPLHLLMFYFEVSLGKKNNSMLNPRKVSFSPLRYPRHPLAALRCRPSSRDERGCWMLGASRGLLPPRIPRLPGAPAPHRPPGHPQPEPLHPSSACKTPSALHLIAGSGRRMIIIIVIIIAIIIIIKSGIQMGPCLSLATSVFQSDYLISSLQK